MQKLKPCRGYGANDGDGYFDQMDEYCDPNRYDAIFYYRDDTDALIEELVGLLREARGEIAWAPSVMPLVKRIDAAIKTLSADKPVDQPSETAVLVQRGIFPEPVTLQNGDTVSFTSRSTDEGVEVSNVKVTRASDKSTSEVVHAQHGETGRVWMGPRNEMPNGYYEVVTDAKYAAQTDIAEWGVLCPKCGRRYGKTLKSCPWIGCPPDTTTVKSNSPT